MHVDTAYYEWARVGVAVADAPAGPYTYLRSFRPHNQQARDLTVFQALITSSKSLQGNISPLPEICCCEEVYTSELRYQTKPFVSMCCALLNQYGG